MTRLIATTLTFFLLIVDSYAYQDTDLDKLKLALQKTSSLEKQYISFEQTNPDGSSTRGALVILNKNNFRWNYFPPYPLVIIGSSKYVSMYDYAMEQLSRIDRAESPIDFLFDNHQAFLKHFEILEIHLNNNQLSVKALDKEYGKKILISYDGSNMTLKELKITELDGTLTKIKFMPYKQFKSADSELFKLKSPKIFGVPARLDEPALLKKISF